MSSDEKIMEEGGEGPSHETPQAITITIMDPSALETTTLDSALVASVEAQSSSSRQADGTLLMVPREGSASISVAGGAKDLLQTVTETHMGTEELPVISNINSSEDTSEQSTIQLVTKTSQGESIKLGEVEEIEELGEYSSRCCLICNEEMQEEHIPVFKSQTTTSHRKVSVFLGGLVGQKLTSRKAHSDIICQKCFALLNKLDLLEVEIRDTKDEIVSKYQESVAVHGGRARRKKPAAARKSDYVFPKIEPEDEDEQAIAMEMDETFEPHVEDLMEEEHDRREDRDSEDEEWEPEFKKTRIKREGPDADGIGPPKRKRGRPRKDAASKPKDMVIIGSAANSPVGDNPDEAAGAVNILRPKNARLRPHRPTSYKPCELCGIIPFSEVERHMVDYHPETLVRPCALCDHRFRTFRQLGNHVLRVHGLCFLCPECSSTYSNGVDFSQHFQESHPESSATFTCVVCRNGFDGPLNYCMHMETHEAEAAILLTDQANDDFGTEMDGDNNFCNYCKKRLKSPVALKRHLLCVHGKRPSFHCEVCYSKFHSSGALLDHTESHTSGVIQCPLCDQQFAIFHHLRSHCDVVHVDAASFHCQYCSHVARSIKTLFTHVLVHHPDKLGLERNVRCSKCGEKFYSGRELTQHKTARHAEMVNCSYCSKAMSKYILSEHINDKHTKEHKSTCPYCGQVFFKTPKLTTHIKRHHKRDQYARFICELCGKAYITRDELQRHTAAHQNERKYKCEFCSRAYFKAGDLTYHRRTHTGERPHACTSCGAAFSRPSELTTHMARAHGLHKYARRYHRTAARKMVNNPVVLGEDIPHTTVDQSLKVVDPKKTEVDNLITEVREDDEVVYVVQEESLQVVHALSQDLDNVERHEVAHNDGDMQVIYVELME